MKYYFEKIPPTSDQKSDRKPEATNDEQRNRVIAKNEARRRTIGNLRVNVWAIMIGVIAVGIVLWPWLSRDL
jgi:hypothetical protein